MYAEIRLQSQGLGGMGRGRGSKICSQGSPDRRNATDLPVNSRQMQKTGVNRAETRGDRVRQN
jgi:hypothetical protein